VTVTRLPPTSGESSSVVLVDQDGDDDPDLVFGRNGAPNVPYLNTHRQLSAPV